MAFKQRHKDLKEVVSQLRSAVNAHGKQADIIEKHIDSMEDSGDSPMQKRVSWEYGGKTYYGDLIPSMETSTHRYARTHNGKVKSLPKNKK